MHRTGTAINNVADFYSVRADFPLSDLRAGQVIVAGSDRRYRGRSRCMAWLAVLGDRALISVPHELVAPIRQVAGRLQAPEQLLADDVTSAILHLCQSMLGPAVPLCCYHGVKLYSCAESYARTDDPNVRRITRGNAAEVIQHLREEGIPDDIGYLLADDAAFACWIDGRPIGFAATHPVGVFSDRIGNIMVGVVESYRRRGCGKALVSATTGELLRQGRTAVWGTLAGNLPAIRTAQSVGYRPYCRLAEVRFE